MSVTPTLTAALDDLRFTPEGLIAAIAQQASDPDHPVPGGRVLMFAWMNREALERTLATRKMHYWSRSRNQLWLKGETSGHLQEVVSWARDCDGDALLFVVRQIGGACHTGYESCFFQALDFDGRTLPVGEKKQFEPGAVYGA